MYYKEHTPQIQKTEELILDDVPKDRLLFVTNHRALQATLFFAETKKNEPFLEEILQEIYKGQSIDYLTALNCSYNMCSFMQREDVQKELSLVQKELLEILRIRLHNGLYITNKIAMIRTAWLYPTEEHNQAWCIKQKNELKDYFSRQVTHLDCGQGFVFYGGYQRHGMLVEIEKGFGEGLSLRIINTGEGAEDNQVSRRYILNSDLTNDVIEIILNIENKLDNSLAILDALKVNFPSVPFFYRRSYNENFAFETQKHGSCAFMPIWAWLNVHLVYGASGEQHPRMFKRLRRAFIKNCLGQLELCLSLPKRDYVNQLIEIGKALYTKLEEQEEDAS